MDNLQKLQAANPHIQIQAANEAAVDTGGMAALKDLLG